ncbi:MAG: response regulator receiver protein [Rickettsiaceae bacterium]|jgi:CheY-like chemotaxis protein|nr:response regulator receiver protein [Rickettsiaceae bacterium]
MIKVEKSPFFILFVDDEENACKYFARTLEVEFNIVTASSIKEAQKIIEENIGKIAVVVTDQRMPGGNGIELLRYLRDYHPGIIRILTTAHSDLSDAIECVNKGEVYRYIQKPWDYELMKSDMRQAVALFDTKMEMDRLLRERSVARAKTVKTDRVRQLCMFANLLPWINFAALSTKAFIARFAVAQNQIKEKDLKYCPPKDEENAETALIVKISEKMKEKISFNQNYDFNTILSYNEIASLCQQVMESKNVGISNVTIFGGKGEITVNEYAFKTAIEELIGYISHIKQKCWIKVWPAENNEVMIVFQINSYFYKTNETNIFLVKSDESDKADPHLHLLICYLLIGHHGGRVEMKDDEITIEFYIYLPATPVIGADTTSIFSAEELNGIIASVND